MLQQCATPRELFTQAGQHLRRRFHRVAGDEHAAVHVDGAGVHFGVDVDPADGGTARGGHDRLRSTIGVRPEALRIGTEGLDAIVAASRSSAPIRSCTARSDGHDDVSVVARTDGLNTQSAGDRRHLMPDTSTMHVFDTATGARLDG